MTNTSAEDFLDWLRKKEGSISRAPEKGWPYITAESAFIAGHKAGAAWQAKQSAIVEHFCDHCQLQATAIPRALGWECVNCGVYYSNPQPPKEPQ